MAILKVNKLRAGYGPIDVLHDIDITVEQGEIVAMIGANGAGKTTTLMAISGVVPARSGSIVFQNDDITNVDAHTIVGAGLTQSPEGRKIFPRLSVRENLRMGAFTREDGADAIDADVEKMFEMFPILKERQNQAGGLLSGGQQQMLAMALRPDGEAETVAIGRTLLGLSPADRGANFRRHQGFEPEGHVRATRRAKRSHGPQSSETWLRSRNRQRRLHRQLR